MNTFLQLLDKSLRKNMRYNAKVMFTLALLVTIGSRTAQATDITDLGAISDPAGSYVITADIDVPSTFVSIASFSGTLEAAINPETHMPYRIKNLPAPLFTTLTGTVRNLVLEDVSISSGTDVGAIACSMTGTSANKSVIYNCGILSGSVGGSGNVGGLVGVLGSSSDNAQCYARVINCYSFANITNGSEKGGIVGYNNYASRHADIRTMVMNCMFYGDIATGGTIAPIYGGVEISNEDKVDNVERRLNNYNYFLYEAPFSKNNTTTNVIISKYNRALAAEERYLTRFEFYRYLVNSTRELAAFYVDPNPETVTISGKAHKSYHVDLMGKWVLDKSIAPYPILKQQGKYPSVVNYDPEYTNDETGAKVLRSSISDTEENRNKGRHIGTLTVYINESNTTTGGQTKPTGASVETNELTLNRTDKDYNNYNFNYDKVQLPYYNDVGTKNYTGSKVVTGWKITGMSKSSGTFSSSTYDAPSYNFADRECTQKDIYSVSGRVFSQGAYFDVPDGVSSITIEPYWGNAAYLSDANYDKYGYGDNGVGSFGLRYNNGSSYSINEDSQPVYTSISKALTRLDNLGRSASTTVYDNAVVLVGNYHKGGTAAPSKDSKPYTIMSADLNFDNEPDYSYISYSGKQQEISPIRFDFINAPGTAMAHKLTSTTTMGIIGNMKPQGWFEVTNTCFIRFSQLEYDYGSKKNDTPLILLGGVVEQIVSTNFNNNKNEASHTNYIHVGSNVWFKLFNNGCHMDKTNVATPHRPISVTGGEYEKFYLSGYFQPNAPVADNAADKNAECYIDGGKFGEVAAASQEKIDGNVTWLIKNADIASFFGGGINEASPVTGDINVNINNSHVGLYCGGPKFGNMTSTDTKKATVETTATSCTFGEFFGAGYGGTALYRDIWSPGNNQGHNQYMSVNYNWSSWLGDSRGYSRGQYVSGKGIAVSFETEQFEGSADKTVARLYVNFATMSVARTNSVTSRLSDCTINKNFYGGGNLGSVNGNLSSTLTNCKVYGNVFGAGCSSTAPTAEVYDSPTSGNFKGVYYNSSTGVFEPTIYPPKVEYTWSDENGGNTDTTTLIGTGDNVKHWIHTDVSLSGLGIVEGKVTLNIDGNTVVMGQEVSEDADGNITYGAQTGGIFGGGDASAVIGETEVVINASGLKSGYAYNVQNVYGGGNNGEIKSNTSGATGNAVVTLRGNTVVNADVFGGGNKGVVEGSATVNITE